MQVCQDIWSLGIILIGLCGFFLLGATLSQAVFG
jgi:hypothetical protein